MREESYLSFTLENEVFYVWYGLYLGNKNHKEPLLVLFLHQWVGAQMFSSGYSNCKVCGCHEMRVKSYSAPSIDFLYLVNI